MTLQNIFKISPSPTTLHRLAEYLCLLSQLPQKEYSKISSSQLAQMMDIKPSQLRQDFHHFGGFGKPGHPYNLSHLREELMKIYGVDKPVNLLISGASPIAEALLDNQSLADLNIRIRGVVDLDMKIQGTETHSYIIMAPSELPEFVENNHIHIGAICSDDPETDLELLVNSGLKAIWNLSPKYLSPSKGIIIYNQNMAAGLLTLIYNLKH
ncbi:MAG: redox-sensing transcriptional repressor Rex [candidate division Zixibacteria bacterium]|nr:redox-sensing transcriptional repressor Rex [Candidatus Tariuqbacter arcticus]